LISKRKKWSVKIGHINSKKRSSPSFVKVYKSARGGFGGRGQRVLLQLWSVISHLFECLAIKRNNFDASGTQLAKRGGHKFGWLEGSQPFHLENWQKIEGRGTNPIF
jgi:hypothetical protein